MNELEDIHLTAFDDVWCWNLEKNSFFSAKFFTLSRASKGNVIYKHPYQSIWSASYPKKVKFFIWGLQHTCLNTHDNLQTRSP